MHLIQRMLTVKTLFLKLSIWMSEVAKHSFGVRGPQRVSVLFPKVCKQLLQVGRGFHDVREVNGHKLALVLDA